MTQQTCQLKIKKLKNKVDTLIINECSVLCSLSND